MRLFYGEFHSPNQSCTLCMSVYNEQILTLYVPLTCVGLRSLGREVTIATHVRQDRSNKLSSR